MKGAQPYHAGFSLPNIVTVVSESGEEGVERLVAGPARARLDELLSIATRRA